MTTLYRGVGGTWSPHADRIDALITKRMQARGFLGRITGKGSLHATPALDHALEYAKDESEEHVLILTPGVGATMTWVPGVRDLLMRFQVFCRDEFWDGDPSPVLRDVQGDVNGLEDYLSFGRQKNAIGKLIDKFLDTITPREITITDDTDIGDVLGAHQGEVWITGACVCEPYVAPEETLGIEI